VSADLLAPATTDACGTDKGYQRHRRRGQEPCESCRQAHRQYMADFRAGRAHDAHGRESARARARSRALWRLANEYPDQYAAIYLEELVSEADDSDGA
jgi:hypothetical protein